MIDSVYKLLEEHKNMPAIKIAHDFSSDIIKKKRQSFEDELNKERNEESKENEEFG